MNATINATEATDTTNASPAGSAPAQATPAQADPLVALLAWERLSALSAGEALQLAHRLTVALHTLAQADEARAYERAPKLSRAGRYSADMKEALPADPVERDAVKARADLALGKLPKAKPASQESIDKKIGAAREQRAAQERPAMGPIVAHVLSFGARVLADESGDSKGEQRAASGFGARAHMLKDLAKAKAAADKA